MMATVGTPQTRGMRGNTFINNRVDRAACATLAVIGAFQFDFYSDDG